MMSSMQKYVEIKVQDLVASGTTTNDETGNLKLEDSGAAFDTDGTAVGDIVWDTSDDRMYTVAAIDDATNLSLTAIGAASGTGLNTGKAYKIYDISSYSKQLVATDGVVIIENASADPINSEVNIQYGGASGIMVKVTHAAAAAGDEMMRDALEDTVEESMYNAWPIVKYEPKTPLPSYVLEIAKV